MMELVHIPGMSAQVRICRMRIANSKKVRGTLKVPFCAPKLRVPKIWFGDSFCMRGGPARKKDTLMFRHSLAMIPILPTALKRPYCIVENAVQN